MMLEDNKNNPHLGKDTALHINTPLNMFVVDSNETPKAKGVKVVGGSSKLPKLLSKGINWLINYFANGRAAESTTRYYDCWCGGYTTALKDFNIDPDKEPLIPLDAKDFEVFAIKDTEDGGKQAFIGFKLSNGNFHYIGVPFTEPKDGTN